VHARHTPDFSGERCCEARHVVQHQTSAGPGNEADERGDSWRGEAAKDACEARVVTQARPDYLPLLNQ